MSICSKDVPVLVVRFCVVPLFLPVRDATKGSHRAITLIVPTFSLLVGFGTTVLFGLSQRTLFWMLVTVPLGLFSYFNVGQCVKVSSSR